MAEFHERGVEAVLEIDEGVGRPEPLAEFFAAHDLPRLR
jgi:hypothetical protein